MRSDGAEGIPIVKPNTELTESLSEDEKIYY